jgi:hypothetical protein
MKGINFMKRTIITGFLFIFTLMAFSAANAQTSKFKTWKITFARSGGLAGISTGYTLDNEGNLNRTNKRQQNYAKIEEARITEIAKLINELKLPGTRLKTVKGLRIYDGIYSSFIITLDGKDYRVEGTSFDDAKYLALSKKQAATLEKLKQKLDELGVVLPEAMTNK